MERREFVKTGFMCSVMLAAAPTFLTQNLLAADAEVTFKELYEKVTKGKTVENGKIKLNIPDEPEKAEKTPVEIEVNYPMTEGDYIAKIYIFTPENRIKQAVVANFSPKSGIAYLQTDVRVGVSQELVILAETNKGKIFKATKAVKATAAGCGA